MIEHLLVATKWKTQGACATLTPAEADALFFTDGRTPKRAYALCGSCPVIDQCREAAYDQQEEYGMWAGEAAPQRRPKLEIAAA